MMGMIIGKICCLVMLCFALFVDLLLKRDASFVAFGNCNVHQYGVLVYCLKWLAIVMSVVGFRWIRTNRMLRDLFFDNVAKSGMKDKETDDVLAE